MKRQPYYSDTPLKMLEERSFECAEGFHLGSSYHYLYRLGRKEGADPIDDLDKAISHLQMLRDLYIRSRAVETWQNEGAE